MFVSPNAALGENSRVEKIETITFAPDSSLKEVPFSMCAIGGDLFLFSMLQEGKVKIFEKNGNSLKFIKDLEINDVQPTYSFYNRQEDRYGFFDYKERRILIFDRVGKLGFMQTVDIPCPRGCYDLDFSGKLDQLIVSGYLADGNDRPFDLYSIDIANNGINYLLPSYEKYGLRNLSEYVIEYRKKQTVAAVGAQAYIDILDDNLFFVWEGSLRIIKINLCSQEKTIFSEPDSQKIPGYVKPDRVKLGEPFLKGAFKDTFEMQKTMGYVRNIFATPGRIYLIYETGRNINNNNVSKLKLITYSANGEFLEETFIPGNPGIQMWFDKERSELSAFSNDKGKFSILKYKIK